MRCPSCGNENRAEARFCDSCGTPLTAPRDREAREDRVPSEAAIDPVATRAAPLPADAPETAGGGRFRLEGFLGEGTRKRVFLARDRDRDDRRVAVAVFSTEGLAATAQARARRELDAMTELGAHPHLVGVVDSGQDGDRPYIASEYMPGGDLGELLAGSPGGRLEVARAIAIAADVAAGLQHAHARQIVHRDIKPANVWLDEDGSARLGDFGLAVGGDRSREEVEGMVVGTAAYLPPEQAMGRRTDARADLYSLGALLYEMLAGEPPFAGDDAVAIISRHLSAEPLAPSRSEPSVPPALDGLVLRLLAKSPQERPADAGQVRAELEAIAAQPVEEAERPDAENPLDDLAGGVFVGREGELEQLKEVLETAISGRGGVALIEGEPGIGKTSLGEELATYARIRGAQVLSTSCHEADPSPAFWTFAQAIRSYVRDSDPVGLAWQLGADGPELARIVPELRERVGSIAEAPPLEGEDARFRFFEAVASFLIGVAGSRPLVLVLDDLHWADSSSIELLRFLARRIGGSPLLVLGAYRQEEAAAREPVQQAIAELEQVPNHRRIALTGLDRGAIARFVELTMGERPREESVERIFEQTGGNPFFVGELVRLTAAGGAAPGTEMAIPSGVREAVERRIARLSEGAAETLEAAAVVGRLFASDLVAALVGRPVEAELEEARAARILERPEGARYGFAHAVFREALYERIALPDRRRLHRRAGEEIERRGAEDPGRVPALARHFLAAGPECTERALEYSLGAGRQAAAQLAHADAAEYLERALELTIPRGEGEAELALRLELGEEQTRAGRFADAREVLAGAAGLAEQRGDPRALGEAVIAIAALSDAGSVDRRLVELIDRALELLGEEHPPLRARLLAKKAEEVYWEDPTREARAISDESIALARSAADDAALAAALATRQFVVVGSPGSTEDRLANADELLAVARRAGDRHSEMRAHAYRLTTLLQLGDVEGCDRALSEYAELARQLGEPRHLWHVPAIRANREIMRGRFAEARELSLEAARLGRLAEEPLAEQFHTIQLTIVHTLEGTVEEVLPAIRRMAERYPAIPAWRLALVGALVEAEREEEARMEFAPIVARGFDQIPRDANWLTGLSRIADAAARIGDAESSQALYEQLLPFAGELAVVGRAAAFNGPVDRVLGLTAAAVGRLDDAVAHLEQGLAICERLGERPIRTDIRLQLGRVLLDRGRDGDRDRAQQVLAVALEEGLELGMRKLVERAVRARLEAQGAGGVAATASIDSVASAVANERPDLVAVAAADGRVTILFSDIENSTLMTERLGDRRWLELLREHNAIFRRHLADHSGYEVKNQGDGFMLAFPDPEEALACAVAVQEQLAAREEEEPIRVRMGMHLGEAIHEEGDFFGRTVILAARIAAQARGGEILVSEALADAAGGEVRFASERELELKGLAGSHRVFSAEWSGRPAAV